MSETETLISESEMDDTGPVEEDPREKRSDSREYMIFQEGNSGNWAEIGKATASNADGAIKAMQPKEKVRYAAVPTRNWSVATPKVKVETTVTLEFE